MSMVTIQLIPMIDNGGWILGETEKHLLIYSLPTSISNPPTLTYSSISNPPTLTYPFAIYCMHLLYSINITIALDGSFVALIIPVPCILYILQMVLTKAVLLRAVYELNREVASLVNDMPMNLHDSVPYLTRI